jgi:aminopeptidase N
VPETNCLNCLPPPCSWLHFRRTGTALAAFIGVLLLAASAGRADEPYARTRDYDLQHVRTSLRFNLDERRILGETTQELAALRDDVARFSFDSVGLEIQGVTLNGQLAKFDSTAAKLYITLPRASHTGDKYEVTIRYTGQPKKGIYFVLPDKNYPERPAEIWTQGEAEETRYYIPIYDYPNDRTTSEMIATVPKDWITISNGKLVGVNDAFNGKKTWHWRQDAPLSTYLITLVAGQFRETRETWHSIPVTYEVPRGMENTIAPTFARTRQMLDFFSERLGVPYPWDQYAQASVDEFVEGGMENTSATTLTTDSLLDRRLAVETHEGSDFLIAHEMFHQWFGDLVTCKDWSNLWLNEGFATFAEFWWEEHNFGADEASYTRWRDARNWMANSRLYPVPIATRDFEDSLEYAGNTYDKAGLVIQMLRQQLGDDAFFRSLHEYLDANRNQNVVTADLVKAIEKTTSTSVDRFFHQWIYGAGAPRFRIRANYEAATHQEKVTVSQTQRIEDQVDYFEVPIEIELTTSAGKTNHWVTVSKANETFAFSVEEAPAMVLFDKGNKILKSVEFEKTPAELAYQLSHAEMVPDRADAAVALGTLTGDEDASAALARAATQDPFWGIRVEAIRALGHIGTPDAAQEIVSALAAPQPWVREPAVAQLGRFKDVPELAPRLIALYHDDPSFRVRAAALEALAQMKAPGAFDLLRGAVSADSPRDLVRDAALRGLGDLGDERAVPLLLEWSALGKPLDSRPAAMEGLGHLDPQNKDIEARLLAYVAEPYPGVRNAALDALAERGDPAAIAPLEALIHNGAFAGDTLALAQSVVSRLHRAEKPSGDAR